MENTINVFIITGFLGAGKTTLLNSLLGQFSTQNNFVIENEVGQVNIDKNLITGNIEQIFEITNGCLCCNLDTELYAALDQIARLTVKPDNLFIETTGIADAGNLSAIFKEDFVKEVFELKKIICIVDVEVIEDFLVKATESGRQIVASDLVILNKVNSISPSDNKRVKEALQKINPYAAFADSPDGSINKDLLSSPVPVKPLYSLNIGNTTNMHDISTVLFETSNLFDIEKLEMILKMSLSIYYNDIYRIKGFVRDSSGGTFVVQSAGKTLSVVPVSVNLTQSQLVLIGRKLTNEIADRLLRPTLLK